MMKTTKENTNRNLRPWFIAAAVVGPILVWLLAELAGWEVAVTMNDAVQAISGVTVAVSAAVAAFGAWGVKAAIDRMFRHPGSWWLTVSLTVGVLSLLGPLTMATTVIGSAVLVAMHVVPAAILIPGLARTQPQMAPELTHTEPASMGSGYGGAP